MPHATEVQEPWASSPSPEVETVSERLQKLEQAISSLKDAEERVLTRLQVATPNGPYPEGLAAGGALVPAAVVGASLPGSSAANAVWSWVAFLSEFRLMFKMYFDPRYRLSRVAQFGVPVVLILMVLNYFFLGYAPLIGFLVERFVLIVLSVVLYKLLSREAARYAAVLEYLQRYSR